MTQRNGHDEDASPSAAIRKLNDKLRTTLTGGKVMMTTGLNALPPEVQARVLAAIRTFDAFTDDNDPWNEHDMGALEVDLASPGSPRRAERIFFKIDYLDPSLTFHSDDPGDPAKTVRVMTIMLADEY